MYTTCSIQKIRTFRSNLIIRQCEKNRRLDYMNKSVTLLVPGFGSFVAITRPRYYRCGEITRSVGIRRCERSFQRVLGKPRPSGQS